MSELAMIELTGISRTFMLGDQPVRALDGIQLSIAQGEYLSVMGPSGSGKSTLLNLLGLLDRPDAGRFLLQGEETTGLSEEARARLRQQRIGFVFQSYHLIGRLTARENIALPLVLAGWSPAQRRERVNELLAMLDLEDRAGHLPAQLSGGQRQRVAIGRAVTMKPALLLADEPTGNLDSHVGREVIRLLESLNQQGITLIVVTHDPAIGQRAQRQIVMRDGSIASDHRAGEQPLNGGEITK